MAATLAELLSQRTREDEVQALLSVLQEPDAGFPVTDWEVGGAARTMVEAISKGLADKSSLVSTVASSVHVQLAKLLADPTWLDLLAEQRYGLARARATYTRQMVTVECVPGLGPQVINSGFIVRAATGRLYVYEGPPVTIPEGVPIAIEVRAESAGSAFRDPAGTITEIVTPLPGLSVSNPSRTFGGLLGAVAKRNAANQGSGTVTPGRAATPTPRNRYYTVTIIASGNVGAGTARVEYVEGGVKFLEAEVTPIPPSVLIASDNITLTFANGPGVGFVNGDRHTFQTPGSPIIASGVDDETNEALARRMTARWSTLSLNNTTAKYEYWLRQASIENAFGVSKVSAQASATVAGQVEILVATATGSLSSETLAALQSYIDARDGTSDTADVQTATDQPISISGTVQVKATEVAAAKAAADVAWQTYIGELPIGGDVSTGFPGVVRLSELVQVVMDAGAVDYLNLQLNGAAANLAIAYSQVATIPVGQLPSEALTWVSVT